MDIENAAIEIHQKTYISNKNIHRPQQTSAGIINTSY